VRFSERRLPNVAPRVPALFLPGRVAVWVESPEIAKSSGYRRTDEAGPRRKTGAGFCRCAYRRPMFT
jgi:hypothetical protein